MLLSSMLFYMIHLGVLDLYAVRMPPGYELVCYSDGKYGWINNSEYRTKSIYRFKYRAMGSANYMYRHEQEDLKRKLKYSNWNICE